MSFMFVCKYFAMFFIQKIFVMDYTILILMDYTILTFILGGGGGLKRKYNKIFWHMMTYVSALEIPSSAH